MRLVIIVLLTMSGAIAYADKVPLELKNSLYALTNCWGQARGVRQYWAARKEIETSLKKYEDGTAIYNEWYLFFVNYICQIPSLSPEWLREGNGEIMMASYSPMTRTSTNIWLNAADCLHRIIQKRDEAYEKWQAIDKKPINGFSIGGNTEEWHTAHNRYVNINNSIGTLERAVTNSFPNAILPTLPDEEGAALYTNVLRRAGLVQ